MKPRVTIGLPVYNGEDYLHQAIESILSQTYTDLELIISDNCSSDATAAIALEYAAKDERVRYHYNRENIGAARNFNALVDLAGGEYFKWLAADDVVAPTYIEHCVAALDAEPRAVLAYTRGAGIDAQGAIIKYCQHPVPTAAQMDPVERFKLFRERSGFSAWPMLYIFGMMRIDVLRETRLQGAYMGADNSCVYEMLFRGMFVEVPQPLSFFRQHAGSFSTFATSNQARVKFFNGRGGLLDAVVGYRRLYFEYLVDIWRAPLSPRQKLMLLWVNAKWALTERNGATASEDSLLVPAGASRGTTVA